GVSFVSASAPQGTTYSSLTGVWTVDSISAGGSKTLVIKAQVVSPDAQTNTATVNAFQFDPDTSNNTASVTETPQQADLSVTKTVNNATPNVGDEITYTVTLSDQGPDDATNVRVSDLLPTGLSFVSANPSHGGYDSASGFWTVGTVSSGASETLSI